MGLRRSGGTGPRSFRAAGGGLLAASAIAAGFALPPAALAGQLTPAASGAQAGASGTRSGSMGAQPGSSGTQPGSLAGSSGTQPGSLAGSSGTQPGSLAGSLGTQPGGSGMQPGAGGMSDAAASRDAAGRIRAAAGPGTAGLSPLAGLSGAPAPVGRGAEATGAVAAGGCARSLNVVAHEDDDLLFINPAVSDDIASGRCVATVFITAGDAGRRAAYWRAREMGAMAAYAAMADVPNDWFEDTMLVEGHRVARFALLRTKIVLVFLRLPDAKGNAKRPGQSLQRLWRGEIRTVGALDSAERYTRAGLVRTLTALMDAYQPDEIRTLDYEGTYGDGDHVDHHTAGYFTHAAQRHYRSPHRITGYLGYPLDAQPENLTVEQRDRKLAYFMAYAPFDLKVCQAAAACLSNFYAPRFSHSVPTGSETVAGRNVAAVAKVRASSANLAAAQQPAKAVDGAIGGAPAAAGSEWTTQGGRAGSWLTLTWPERHRLNEIDLYDRPNPHDQVTAGVLEFSDGSAVPVGPLPNNGASRVVRFPPRDVTGVRFRITAVSGSTRSVGLAEIRAYTVAPAS